LEEEHGIGSRTRAPQGAKGLGPWSRKMQKRGGRHSGTMCSAIDAMGINLPGYEKPPNCAEPQPRAQVQRFTTIIPTPKGTAEQRTAGNAGGRLRIPTP